MEVLVNFNNFEACVGNYSSEEVSLGMIFQKKCRLVCHVCTQACISVCLPTFMNTNVA